MAGLSDRAIHFGNFIIFQLKKTVHYVDIDIIYINYIDEKFDDFLTENETMYVLYNGIS